MSSRQRKATASPNTPATKEGGGRPQAAPTAQNGSGTLRTLISENLKPVWAALATAVVGVFGFWLSPLREVLAHWLIKENAAILLSVDSQRVLEGSPVQLRVIVTPQAAIHIEKGIVTIGYDKRRLRLRAGQPTFPSPVIEAPALLPEGNVIEFIAIAPGTSEIKVELRTKYGAYSAVSRVQIEEPQITTEATRENLTGRWKLMLGGFDGKMEIHQQGYVTITGSYFLVNGDKGVIDGGRDGDRFWGSFTRGSSITKWKVQKAEIITNQNYLELKGTAYLERASPNGWKREGPDTEFYATVTIR